MITSTLVCPRCTNLLYLIFVSSVIAIIYQSLSIYIIALSLSLSPLITMVRDNQVLSNGPPERNPSWMLCTGTLWKKRAAQGPDLASALELARTLWNLPKLHLAFAPELLAEPKLDPNPAGSRKPEPKVVAASEPDVDAALAPSGTFQNRTWTTWLLHWNLREPSENP